MEVSFSSPGSRRTGGVGLTGAKGSKRRSGGVGLTGSNRSGLVAWRRSGLRMGGRCSQVGAAVDRAAPHRQGWQAGNAVASTGVDLKLWAWGVAVAGTHG
jgi:hypothetical protein